MEVNTVIVYKGILEKLKSAGYSTYALAKKGLIGQATLTNIRNGKAINTATLDTICELLNCQPGEVLEYIPNQKTEEEPASE